MNDRFKFRVWDTKSMVYINSGSVDIRLGIFSTGNLLDVPRFILEQCTGQRDINRKLIYEGDILKDRGNGRWKVIWDDDEIAFCVVSGRRGFVYYLSDFEDCEVIGNIHQNPELLKESK